jgi:hypothetical protein
MDTIPPNNFANQSKQQAREPVLAVKIIYKSSWNITSTVVVSFTWRRCRLRFGKRVFVKCGKELPNHRSRCVTEYTVPLIWWYRRVSGGPAL